MKQRLVFFEETQQQIKINTKIIYGPFLPFIDTRNTTLRRRTDITTNVLACVDYFSVSYLVCVCVCMCFNVHFACSRLVSVIKHSYS